MKLMSAAGRALELVILQYEHPDVTEDRWESNWLVLSGQVSDGDRSWRFSEPCVTTFELADLADWLEDVASGRQEADSFGFAEPNLEFECASSPAPVLRLRFRDGSAPDWLEPAARHRGVSVELPLQEVDLRAAAADLRNALIDYPIRGGAA
jgi:hypothetical protein